MIVIVDALNRDQYGGLLEKMFRLRAQVFEGRLGWNVTVRDGLERDEFDDLDPAYVIGVDDDGEVVSCVRALQTTGPHMLANVFSDILDGEPPLRSSQIWESTRFCVDTTRLGRGRGPRSISHATTELMIGSLLYAKASGITDIITVIDPVMDRVLKRSDNAPYGYVGITAPMGKVSAMAALLDCTDERIERLRNFADIRGDVFATPVELSMLSDRPADEDVVMLPFDVEDAEANALTSEMIRDYLEEQLRSSRTRKEREAVIELQRKLAQSTHFQNIQPASLRYVH